MALELDPRQRAMLQEMGVRVWLPETGVALPQRELPASAPGPIAPPVPVAATPGSTDWPTLTQSVQACQACTLCAQRSHPTLLPPADDGVPCDWLVLGDPPDEDEDLAGAPFAGQDGVLLSNMLRALGLQHANPLSNPAAPPAVPARRAYVSNALKCRPTHGAVPTVAELLHCSAWLQQEIALVQPKIILSLGRFANQMLLGEGPQRAVLPMGKLRGAVHRYQGTAVVVSYAPKLLLRTGADKARAWADLCLAADTVQAAQEALGQ
jgi:DNA polymerase